jgi:hypothetical protein
MGSYNGLVAQIALNGSTVSQVMGSTGVTYIGVTYSVPAKFFIAGQFGLQVTGISGTIGVQIVGAVGGATYVIAGRTNISATGGYPVPLVVYVGTSGAVTNVDAGIPRPAYVAFGAAGLTATIGVTASVFLCAEYN